MSTYFGLYKIFFSKKFGLCAVLSLRDLVLKKLESQLVCLKKNGNGFNKSCDYEENARKLIALPSSRRTCEIANMGVKTYK